MTCSLGDQLSEPNPTEVHLMLALALIADLRNVIEGLPDSGIELSWDYSGRWLYPTKETLLSRIDEVLK